MTWPQKNTMTKINTNTKTNTFREHIQIVIKETCDFWDMSSEWWGDMTWPTKRQSLKQWKRQSQRQIDGPWRRHDMVCELEWIVYILDSCEPEFRSIIVTWQLRVTLDSICNSCDVLRQTSRSGANPEGIYAEEERYKWPRIKSGI